jgi:hypothetical protein
MKSKEPPTNPLSTPSAAEGGGQRPAFTEDWWAAKLDHRKLRLAAVFRSLLRFDI